MWKQAGHTGGIPERNVVSRTAMIVGNAQNRLVEKALETSKQMQLAGVKSDSTTLKEEEKNKHRNILIFIDYHPLKNYIALLYL